MKLKFQFSLPALAQAALKQKKSPKAICFAFSRWAIFAFD
jgi:hypothetical protein